MIGAFVPFALRQGLARHQRRALQAKQTHWIIEQIRPLPVRLDCRGAQLVGAAGAVAKGHRCARLQQRLHSPRRPAGDVRRLDAVQPCQDMHHRPRFAVEPRTQDYGFVFVFQ